MVRYLLFFWPILAITTTWISGAPSRPPEESLDLIEGDIIKVKIHSVRNLVMDPGRLWPNKTLYYEFSDEFHPLEKGWIQQAILSLQNLTCVKIQERVEEEHYVFIRNKMGCAAPVGFYPVGKVEMFLQLPHCLKWGTIQHEFLHSLGFWHEHTRPDRDNYVRVQWANVVSGMETNFISRTEVEAQFEQMPYDYGSVMHYRKAAFSKDPELPTLVPLNDDAEIGQRKKVSKIDVAKLNRLYDCGTEYYLGDELVVERTEAPISMEISSTEQSTTVLSEIIK